MCRYTDWPNGIAWVLFSKFSDSVTGQAHRVSRALLRGPRRSKLGSKPAYPPLCFMSELIQVAWGRNLRAEPPHPHAIQLLIILNHAEMYARTQKCVCVELHAACRPC